MRRGVSRGFSGSNVVYPGRLTSNTLRGFLGLTVDASIANKSNVAENSSVG